MIKDDFSHFYTTKETGEEKLDWKINQVLILLGNQEFLKQTFSLFVALASKVKYGSLYKKKGEESILQTQLAKKKHSLHWIVSSHVINPFEVEFF